MIFIGIVNLNDMYLSKWLQNNQGKGYKRARQ